MKKGLFVTSIRVIILLFITIAFMQGCKKNISANPHPVSPEESAPKTPADILIEKPWRLLSYGFDRDKNGLIDGTEESIRECDKDNSYTFSKDGSGVVAENVLICDGNSPVNQFAWTLTNNDTVLDFYYGEAYVLQLTTDRLFIANTNIDEAKLLLVYGH